MTHWGIVAGMVAAMTLAACQSSSQQPVEQERPGLATVDCAAATPVRMAKLERQISKLEARQARGYRSNNSVVRIANPFKVCASPVPYVSLCTPSPKIRSTLPGYADYKRDRARLEALQRERAQLHKVRVACR